MKRSLGAHGPSVTALGLGCMSFGGFTGKTTPEDSLAAMDAAWDIGIDHFDTANIYGPHTSEEVIGAWMKRTGHRPILASKAAIQRDKDRPANNDPSYLKAELEGSLHRLGIDHLPLFYIHRREQAVPVEDVAGAMGDLIKDGKIGGWGMSEVSPTTLRRAHSVTPVSAIQNEYSLWTRQPEMGLIQTCAELGTAFVAFSPLGRGIFGTPPLTPASPDLGGMRGEMPRFQSPNWEENAKKIEAFQTLAADHGVAAPALALAWLLAKGDHVIPIPGSRTAAKIRAWEAAPQLSEDAELLGKVDALLPVGWAWGDRYSAGQSVLPERYC